MRQATLYLFYFVKALEQMFLLILCGYLIVYVFAVLEKFDEGYLQVLAALMGITAVT